MRIYMSSPQGTSTNLARNVERIARLHRRGVLDDASTVWMNSDLRTSVFWTMSARPACILWMAAPTSGTVRLTKKRIRWGATYNGSAQSPAFDVDLDDLPVESIRQVTVVVDHGHPTEPVQVVDGADSVKLTDGFYQGAGAAVIDLAKFRPSAYDATPSTPSTPSAAAYAASVALAQGTKLLKQGMSTKQIEAIESDPDSHGTDLNPEMLASLVGAVGIFDDAARFLTDKVKSHRD